MTTTPNLGLTQYDGTDTINFLTQYNDDLSKIDTATGDNGWISARATLTYASASAPTFVCNTSIDLTTRISVGMKIKLTQTTTKYFFVTAITSTTITLYGGTDYVVVNATISNVYYSIVKSPFGFPMNPNKWSVQFLKQTNTEITSLPANTWKASTDSIVVPIGDWKLSAKLGAFCAVASPYGSIIYITISTNTTTETNPKLTFRNIEGMDGGTTFSCITVFVSENIRNETAQTFTILGKAIASAPTFTIDGASSATFLIATCAYL